MSGPSFREIFALLREDVACVANRDPAARGKLEILLTYPGVHAVIHYRFANWLWRRGWFFSARLLAWLSRFAANIDIHPAATIGPRFFIDHGAGVVIGATAIVGADVTLYHGVTLGGVSWTPGRRHPTLEDGVLCGAGAKILGPITIGREARIGANSVVVEDVPPGATVVGIPGRVVRALDQRRILAGGRVDLDHHLMPDPVGEALSYLIDRVNFLEVRLAETRPPGTRRRSRGEADKAESGSAIAQ